VRRYFALYLVLFAALAVVIGLTARREARRGAPPVPSTFILGPEGYRAAWRLLETSDVPVRRHMRPLEELPEGRGNLLVLAAPRSRPITELEATFLRGWVSSGNTLVWLTGLGDPDTWRRDATGIRSERREVHDTEGNLEWALEVSLEALSFDRTEPVERFLPAVLGTAWTAGVDQLYIGTCIDLKVHGKEWSPLAGSISGASVHVREMGEGRILLFPTPDLLDNEGLPRADNVTLLRNLVQAELGPEGVVLFDEYHHGYSPSPLASVPASPVFRAGAFQALLLLGLFLWSRGRRFGPAVPLVRDERRPAVEYLHAMAKILRHGGKTPEVARDLVRGFRARLETRAGIPARLGDAQAVALLGRRTGRDWDGLRGWLGEVRAGRVDRPRYLVRLARALRTAERALEVPAARQRSG
jgi:hypothetical protein